MPANHILLNFVGELPGESSSDTMIIGNDTDYCQVSEILRNGNVANLKSIWVRNEHHFAWIRQQAEIFGYVRDQAISIARKTARALLSERWEMEIPEWLSDQLILENDLLDQQRPEGARDAVSVILSPVLGQFPEKITARFLSSLAEKLSAEDMASQLSGSLMETAWEAKLKEWAALPSSLWLSGYCERLQKKPDQLWRDLTVWRLLRRYPKSALDYALDPGTAAWVRSLPEDAVEAISLHREGLSLALDQINMVLASAKSEKVTRIRFENLSAAVSGELLEEFAAMEGLLEKAEFPVTEDDVREVRRRFKNCSVISESRLQNLSLVVPPPAPSDCTKKEMDADSWRNWALAEYLPYRWWQIQKQVSNAQVEESVASFSQWYCDQYHLVHSDLKFSAVQILSRWRDEILKDKVSLILLVDNLPWFFCEMLEKALATAGLHRHSSGYSFAPLPSHTAVCKPQLVLGKPDATGSDYLKLLRNRSDDEWQGREVHYLMGVDQLTTMPNSDQPYVALLNYLAADEALHRDAAAEGSSWSEQLNLLFGNLARAVGDFAKQVTTSGRGFGLYVITDHGATMILPDERQAVDAQLTKKLFPNEKHRSATLSAAEVGQIPANFWSLGHRVSNWSGDATYFIPRGHNTVAAAGSRMTFSHGGATPEEVLIPSGLFRLYTAEWGNPRVRFVDLEQIAGRARFYIKRMVNLTFEIQNPNLDDCRLEAVRIPEQTGEVRHFDAILIPANGTAQGSLNLYFSNSSMHLEMLSIIFELRIGQQPLSCSIDLPVTITSATTSGIDLNNLLS